jgi:serine/threonine-protein kinase
MTKQEFQQRYTISDRLGEGGFGEVFKAYDTVRDRWVALKVSKVKPELESVRLRNEVETVSHLPEHPNIAFYEACYSFQEMLGEYDYGILQYYDEGNLLQLLGKDTTFCVSTEQKIAVLTQILDGLEFLHKNCIIHRDLKPQNILIARRQNG